LRLGTPDNGGDRIIMSKKLFKGLAPLFAIAALAVMPAAAGAIPHYFHGSTTPANRLGSTNTKVIAWGTLQLHSALGEVQCENGVLANVSNPSPGGAAGPAGVGETLSFSAPSAFIAGSQVGCTAAGCPGIIEVSEVPASMPWPSVLQESPIRQASGNAAKPVEVLISCPGIAVAVVFHTEKNPGESGAFEQKPLTIAGSGGCSKPSELEFGPGSGELISAFGPGTTTGSLKTCGYEKQELILTAQG